MRSQSARIGELLRLQLFSEAPHLDLDTVRLYLANLAALYPPTYDFPILPTQVLHTSSLS